MFVIRHESTAVAVLWSECRIASNRAADGMLFADTRARCMAGYDCLAMTNDIIEKLRKHLAGGVRTWIRRIRPLKKRPMRPLTACS